MTANDNHILAPGTMFQARYRVVRAIKAGSMGAVYEVIDHKTESRRALKVMLPGLVDDPELRARFVQEAKITGGIESDHIIRVLDADVDVRSGTPFLVMDLLRGEELGRIVKSKGPLSQADVAGFLFQAALALDKTHAAGIVHRDLKPQNLFLTYRDDGSPCVKILDFGIAKLLAQRDAQSTRAIGTPLYMAPEQVRGDRALGPQVDIYALGQIAYTLLVGEPYWSEELRAAGTVFPLLARIVEGLKEAPCVRAARRNKIELPAGFNSWFFKVTSVRPELRFERASEAVAALTEALGTSGIRPSRPAYVEPQGLVAWNEPRSHGHDSGLPPQLDSGLAGVSAPKSSWLRARPSGSRPQLELSNVSLVNAAGGTYTLRSAEAGVGANGAKSGVDPKVGMSMDALASVRLPRRVAVIVAMGSAILAGLVAAAVVVAVLLHPGSSAPSRDAGVAAEERSSSPPAPADVELIPEPPASAPSAQLGSDVKAAASGPTSVPATKKAPWRGPAAPRKGSVPAPARPKRSIY